MTTPTIPTLYSPRFDFPRFVDLPREMVMLATLPRTGSTLLGIEMWRTGVLGAPLEYFNLREGGFGHTARPDNPTGEAYLHSLLNRRTSTNGIFSFKMFVHDYTFLVKNDPSLLKSIYSTKVIYLTRLDRLSQAISYARASQTGRWFHDSPLKEPKEEYNRVSIMKALFWIRNQEESWENLFRKTGCKPLRVYYEEFSQDPRRINHEIMKYAGVEHNASKVVNLPSMTAQTDEISTEWKRRFMSEASSNGEDASTGD